MDNVKRYTVGTVKNIAKFLGQTALKEVGGMLGDMVGGGNDYIRKVGKNAGGEISKSLGFSNYDGWHHHCPYCQHKWK